MSLSASSSHRNSLVLTIRLHAIAENYSRLKKLCAPVECAAVVKANAYGMGITQVAPVLARAGCTVFFVATLDEGIALRNLLAETPLLEESAPPDIYVFHGVFRGEEADFVHFQLRPVLNDLSQIFIWDAYAEQSGKTLAAAIHIDTGMCRLGLNKRSALYLNSNRQLISHLDIRFLMSHLACADEPDHFKNSRQYLNVMEIVANANTMPISLANSSGIFLDRKFHFDLVRPGSALYGINPTPHLLNPMQQVVTLTSRILQIRDIDLIQTVGYGATYKAMPGTRIAVVEAGYADGYLRSLSNSGFCSIAGRRCPVVGRVSMDMITVDITGLDSDLASVGTPVELLGNDCPPDEIALLAGTNAYELFTGFGPRPERVYLHSSD